MGVTTGQLVISILLSVRSRPMFRQRLRSSVFTSIVAPSSRRRAFPDFFPTIFKAEQCVKNDAPFLRYESSLGRGPAILPQRRLKVLDKFPNMAKANGDIPPPCRGRTLY